jgi:hypothetical protein
MIELRKIHHGRQRRNGMVINAAKVSNVCAGESRTGEERMSKIERRGEGEKRVVRRRNRTNRWNAYRMYEYRACIRAATQNDI